MNRFKHKKLIALGTMSGTSLDGVDISIIKTDGTKIYSHFKNYYFKYPYNIKSSLNDLLKNIDENYEFKKLDLYSKMITDFHIKIIKKIPELKFVDLIGFHGQTIYHNPKNKISIQLGDGKLISNILNKKLIYNFRQNDLLHNGQGAPLAPIYHKYIIKDLNLTLPCCILNIGGVSNITYWDGNNLIGFDTGPGNSLIDYLMLKFFNKNFDEDGKIAFKGKILNKLITQILNDVFFKLKYPKSLDKQYFNHYLKNLIEKYKAHDLISTFSEFTAVTISHSLKLLPHYPDNIVVMGGGSKNLYIIERLKKHLKCRIIQKKNSKYNPDFVESQLMAFLAVRSINNLPYTFPLTTGVLKPLSGGELCIPKETH